MRSSPFSKKIGSSPEDVSLGGGFCRPLGALKENLFVDGTALVVEPYRVDSNAGLGLDVVEAPFTNCGAGPGGDNTLGGVDFRTVFDDTFNRGWVPAMMES
jgi:hypothetical protein